MNEADGTSGSKRVLTVFAGILLIFAVAMVLVGEFLLAGVTFLGLAFALYLREST